jgi:hypothetical protein
MTQMSTLMQEPIQAQNMYREQCFLTSMILHNFIEINYQM